MKALSCGTSFLRVLISILAIWISTQALAEPADKLEQNKTLVLQAIAALDAGELDRLDQYIAKAYRRHSQATPDAIVNSLDDFKILLQAWNKTFADIVTTIDVLVAEGDLVAFTGSFTATQVGPMGPFPATGKQMYSEFAGYHRIVDGKMVETWVTWDNLAALAQLGHFPPTQSEPTN